MTGKELFELSKRFHVKCEETLNEGECTGCSFKGDKDKAIFPCPEFYFRTEEQANNFLDFIGEKDKIKEIVDMLPNKVLKYETIGKSTSPNFVDCTFNDCEIYRYGMNN